jgi:hypothetical protein
MSDGKPKWTWNALTAVVFAILLLEWCVRYMAGTTDCVNGYSWSFSFPSTFTPSP